MRMNAGNYLCNISAVFKISLEYLQVIYER